MYSTLWLQTIYYKVKLVTREHDKEKKICTYEMPQEMKLFKQCMTKVYSGQARLFSIHLMMQAISNGIKGVACQHISQLAIQRRIRVPCMRLCNRKVRDDLDIYM